jgi:hypothetical protein
MADMPFTVFHYTFNNVNYFKYGLVNKKVALHPLAKGKSSRTLMPGN